VVQIIEDAKRLLPGLPRGPYVTGTVQRFAEVTEP
jgi:hypothetical protein